MRMSRRLGAGGKLNVICTFIGAPGETLTFVKNDTTAYTVAENTPTKIKQGVYEVTGSLSGHTETITVKKAGTYNVYPKGAVYWYGREVYAMSAVAQYSHSGLYATKNANNIHVRASYPDGGSWKSRYAYTCTSNKVDTSGYNTLKFKVNRSEFGGEKTRQVQIGYSSSQSYSYNGHTFTTKADTAEYSVTSPKSSVYLGLGAYTASEDWQSVHTAAAYLYAIWME